MSYLVLKATRDDAHRIAEFQLAMAWETEKKQLDLATVLTAVNAVFEDVSRGQYIVAKHEDIVVASLLITYEWSDWRNSNMWYIQSVYVSPAHRRQGVFSRMYSGVIEGAKQEQVRFVRLYVETENEKAQQTYEKHGMQRLPYFMYQAEIK